MELLFVSLMMSLGEEGVLVVFGTGTCSATNIIGDICRPACIFCTSADAVGEIGVHPILSSSEISMAREGTGETGEAVDWVTFL